MLMAETAVAVIFRPSRWSLAHATFYGDETASETMGIYVIVIFNYNLNLLNKC